MKPGMTRLGRMFAAARPHALLLALLAVGLALRIVTTITLWPAMWNSDTSDYLHTARTGALDTIRPSGFAFFVASIPGWHRVWPVTALQHALGLLLAIGIYVVLRRWQVPRWASALATAPVL